MRKENKIPVKDGVHLRVVTFEVNGIPTVVDVFALGGLEFVGAFSCFFDYLVGAFPGGSEFARVNLLGVLENLTKDPIAYLESADPHAAVIMSGGLLLVNCIADARPFS